jgi:hypothetical protein
MRKQCILKLDGTEPFAAGFNEVFRMVDDLNETVLIDGYNVPGEPPALLK